MAQGREHACQCRGCKRPGSGRSPGGGHSSPLQCSCLEWTEEPGGLEPVGRRVGHRELSSCACTLRLGKAEMLPHFAQAMATNTISVPPRGAAWPRAPASTPSGLEWVMLPAGQRVPAWGGGPLASLFIAKARLAEGACLLSLSARGSSEPKLEPRSCPPDLRRWHPEPQGAVLAADPVGHTQVAGPL